MRIRTWILLAMAGAALTGQGPGPIQRETLGRGMAALRASETDAIITWRLLPAEEGKRFHLFRQVNGGQPVELAGAMTGATYFTDREAPADAAVRYLLADEQREIAHADLAPAPYLSIPLDRPDGGVTPDGVAYTYNANDGGIGDLDGDGEFEVILKWDPTNAKDNSQSGYTGNVYLDAYRLDGTRLWRIDLGPNVRAGAHYTQFLAYDFDGDGRAEVACKTGPGSRDGEGSYVAMDPGRFHGPHALFQPEEDHRNAAGYVLTGHEFFTIFEGTTGRELASAWYHPPRNGDPKSANVAAWGDNYGNRVDRFLAAVAYVDGARPSLIFARGYYTRTVLDAWNWRDGKLERVWTFDSRDGTAAHRRYEGQGNHSLSVADVDGDGRDEILYGAMAVDDDGRGLYATGWGHGDALHAGDLAPSRPGLEAFQPHETPALYGPNALEVRDARTGELLCGVEAAGDIGRGVAADIDPRYAGAEFWGSGSTGGLYNVSTCAPDAAKGPRGQAIAARKPGPINFLIWWDADPLRELLDGTTISKWDWEAAATRTLLSPAGLASNNGTKATPVLSGDILGDWREEVIWRTADNTALRIYVTPIPARDRRVTLLADRQYRLALVWQNVGYNQPPHPSYAIE